MGHFEVCGINKFVERDIDMLVAEELRVNAAFCDWLMNEFGKSEDLILPALGTNVSVVEDGSEASLPRLRRSRISCTGCLSKTK